MKLFYCLVLFSVMPSVRCRLVLNPSLRLLLVVADRYLLKFERLDSLISHYLLILLTFGRRKIHRFAFKELLACRIYQNFMRFRLQDFQIFFSLFYRKSLKLFQVLDLQSHIESSLFIMDYLKLLIQLVSQLELSCSYLYRNLAIHVLIIMANIRYSNLDYLCLNRGFGRLPFTISPMIAFVLEKNSSKNHHFCFKIDLHQFLLFVYLKTFY